MQFPVSQANCCSSLFSTSTSVLYAVNQANCHTLCVQLQLAAGAPDPALQDGVLGEPAVLPQRGRGGGLPAATDGPDQEGLLHQPAEIPRHRAVAGELPHQHHSAGPSSCTYLSAADPEAFLYNPLACSASNKFQLIRPYGWDLSQCLFPCVRLSVCLSLYLFF